MLDNRNILRRTGWLALLCWSTWAGWACNVPVFRYALERWPADNYELIVFHNQPFTPEQEAMLQAWRSVGEKSAVNLALEAVNVTGEIPKARQELWKSQTNAALPWVVVAYPPGREMDTPVWSGPLGSPVLKTLLDSPARREITRSLLTGASSVWVLLESGDKARDNAAANLLQTESQKLQKTLQLPEAAPDDPKIRSEIPLKIAFSTVRVSRSNPIEQLFVKSLLQIHPDITKVAEPMMFAVFGRGRALPPLFGKDLSASVLGEAAEFMISACSCQVKSMNPGFDLLLAADWENSLETRVVKDPELPPLISLASVGREPPRAAGDVAGRESPRAADNGVMLRNMRVLFVVGILGLVAGTIVIMARRSR